MVAVSRHFASDLSHPKMKLSKIKIVFMALFSQFVTVTSLDLTLLPVSVFESFQSVGRSNILTTHPGMLPPLLQFH